MINPKYILIFMIIQSANVCAETELSSNKNIFPFKYKPTNLIELQVIQKDNHVRVIYPNNDIQEITTIESKSWSGNQNITKDLNFDGYIDLAIWVGVNPRGLNDSYKIFLWSNKKNTLIESGNIVNPGIEMNFLTENILDTTCLSEDSLCQYITRYKWKNYNLKTHSSLIPAKDNQTKITFFKDEKIMKTVIVPYNKINSETKKWDSIK